MYGICVMCNPHALNLSRDTSSMPPRIQHSVSPLPPFHGSLSWFSYFGFLSILVIPRRLVVWLDYSSAFLCTNVVSFMCKPWISALTTPFYIDTHAHVLIMYDGSREALRHLILLRWIYTSFHPCTIGFELREILWITIVQSVE